MNPTEILKNLSEKLHSSATVKSVFGDPITLGEKVVIPVARIGYGFGAGGGSKSTDTNEPHFGGGGGAGIGVQPAGVLEITSLSTRFIRFDDYRRLGGAVAAGFVLGVIFARRRKRSRR